MSESLKLKILTFFVVLYFVFYYAFSHVEGAKYYGLLALCIVALIFSLVTCLTHRDDKRVLRAEMLADIIILGLGVYMVIKIAQIQ